MARGKPDLSNTAIRMFLHRVGIAYDAARGFPPFKAAGPEWDAVLKHFESGCAYCGEHLTAETLVQDHLIPTNKESLGLHAWGNVVPACEKCNGLKHHREWTDFLEETCAAEDYLPLMKRIKAFMKKYGYMQSNDLKPIAANLYEDIGEVCMTLIELRIKQAKAIIDGQIAAAVATKKEQ